MSSQKLELKTKSNKEFENILKNKGYIVLDGEITTNHNINIKKPEEVTIRVYNSAEYDSYMRVYKKHPGRPVCKMIAGILAGAWSEYVGKPCRALEVKCLGKGDKYCEFIVEPII